MRPNLVSKSFYSWLLSALFLLIAGNSIAQQKVADSLIKILNKHTQQDTARISLLTKLSLAYIDDKQAEGIKYADQAIALAKQLEQPLLLAKAYQAKGRISGNEPQKALTYHLLALKIFTQENNEYGIAKSYISLSGLKYALADYIAGLDYGKKALYQSTQIDNKSLIASSLNNMGINYISLGDYSKALDCYLKELKIVQELNEKLGIAKTYGNIGLVYLSLEKYPESLVYDKKCLAIFKELNNKAGMAAILGNIGFIYGEQGDHLKALEMGKKTLAINQSINNKKGIANNLMGLGATYHKLNNYSEALNYMDKAIALYDTLGAKNNLSKALGAIAYMYCFAPADILLKHGVDPKQRYAVALSTEQRSLALAYQVKDVGNEANQQDGLSLIYEKKGDYNNALKSYRIYTKLQDSLASGKKKQEIDRMAMKYDFDEQQAKEELELSRQKVIKNASIAIGVILLIAALAVLGFYKRRNDARSRQKEAEFKVNVAETELKVLRSQLNPHFIFNSLNSIGDYIARHDKDTADEYLTKFAHLMRMILENSESEVISLADDIKVLELYMQLEGLRLGHQFIYEINIDSQVDAENTLVPPMLLQPFVENSIWHGLGPKEGNGRIIISVKKQGDMIEYDVEDNGVGRIKAKTLNNAKDGVHKKSLGIKVIQSRIDILNEIKNAKASITITDLDGGTRVSLTLPLNLQF